MMKEKQRKFGIVTGLILMLGMVGISSATLIELPLDCAGTYDRTNYWELNFDLGVEFTDIAHVYIEWSGEILAGKAAYINMPNDPFIVPVGINTYIGNPPDWKHTDFWGGVLTYPNPQPFDVNSEFIYGKMPWSELFDGKGTITIHYSAPLIMDGYIVEHGSVLLNSAVLKVDGVLVPEPFTIIILSMGVGGVLLRKNNTLRNSCRI